MQCSNTVIQETCSSSCTSSSSSRRTSQRKMTSWQILIFESHRKSQSSYQQQSRAIWSCGEECNFSTNAQLAMTLSHDCHSFTHSLTYSVAHSHHFSRGFINSTHEIIPHRYTKLFLKYVDRQNKISQTEFSSLFFFLSFSLIFNLEMGMQRNCSSYVTW